MSPARIAASDLNPKLRAKLGVPRTAAHNHPNAPKTGGNGCRWRCVPCGADSAVWTAWDTVQRHVDTVHGGGRIEIILEETP